MSRAEPARPPTPFTHAYRALTLLLTPVMWLSAWRSGRKSKAPPHSMAQKMGHIAETRPPGPLLWLYGSGLGELSMAKPVVERILERWPHCTLLVTSKNLHNRAVFARIFRAGTIFQCAPLDTPVALRRFCAHWRPDFVLWIRRNPTPNFIHASRAYGPGYAILQAEISAKAAARERWLLPLFHETFDPVQLIVPQSDADARRFTGLGAPNVLALGDLRNCGAPLAADAAALERARAAIGDRPRWVAASTRDDEYLLAGRVHRVLAARHPGLLTIIAPRKPGIGARLEARLRAEGFTVTRRTAGQDPSPDADIYLADTLGEMGLWYRLSPIAFVGGTFARKGGHNVLEPARLGAAVVCGPDVRNIAAIAAEMVAAGALRQVATEAELIDAVGAWLGSPDLLARTRAVAEQFARHSAMSSERMFDALRPYLERKLAGADRAREG